jgi:nucleotide-binding universal stress UspA family protein
MNTNTRLPTIRRIVVTLDNAESGRPLVEIAVRLAAVLGAELEGVFIEDINLIRLSELPFLREIKTGSLVEEMISTQGMQRDLRALARQAERMLLQAAQASGIGCSFRVWRGRVTAETLSSSFEADVISLRGGGAITAYQTQSILRMRAPARQQVLNTVNVLFSGSPAAERALAAACQLAENLAAEINVLLADMQTPATDLEARARDIVAGHHLAVHFIPLTEISLAALTQAVGICGRPTVLIAGVDHPLFNQLGLGACLETLTCPVLFVR